MDALLLARIQFAMTIGFHFIFPSLSIGLACTLAVLEGIGYFGKNDDFKKIARYIAKFFIITFAVGVATGVVMALQFGTNWSRMTNAINDIFGIFLVGEVIFAFFLESFFIGVYIFGRGRVSPFVHWLSIVLVAIGTLISSFWILVANSWMHSPAGYELVNGKFILKDLSEAVFNPSMFPRFLHTVNSTLVAAAFFLMGLCAYLILKNKGEALAKKLMGGAILFAVVSCFLELGFGHLQIVNVSDLQKAKFATIEGVEKTSDDPPMLLFGIPDQTSNSVKAKIEVPGMMKYLFMEPGGHHVVGLEDIKDNEQPPVLMPFIGFHLMVYLGSFMIFVSCIALYFYFVKKLYEQKWLLRLLVWMMPVPVIVIQLGWMVTEVGRQPWVIQGLLKTADAVSIVNAGQILFSIILIGLIEVLCISLWLSLVVKYMRQGPEMQGGKA
jgi:cytochrome bd ubiquinol oxidase subunit I